MNIRPLGTHSTLLNQGQTSCYQINQHYLLDVGSGVQNLTIDEVVNLKGIFISHAHLDHVLGLPFLLLCRLKANKNIDVYATEQTREHLEKFIFNDVIWPSLTTLSKDQALIKWHIISANNEFQVENLTIRTSSMNHSIPSIGFIFSDTKNTVAFTGDTGACPEFWQSLNQLEQLDWVIVDACFDEAEVRIAQDSGHYTPISLKQDWALLTEHTPQLGLVHYPLEPGVLDTYFNQLSIQKMTQITPLSNLNFN